MLIFSFFSKSKIVDYSVESEQRQVDAVCLLSLLLVELVGENFTSAKIHDIELSLLDLDGKDNM
jgi:hypothetical protein